MTLLIQIQLLIRIFLTMNSKWACHQQMTTVDVVIQKKATALFKIFIKK